MKLMAMSISGNLTPNLNNAVTCQALSKFGLIILGLWASQPSVGASVVSTIKSFNPQCIVGAYTIFESSLSDPSGVDADVANYLTANNHWWLDLAGLQVSNYPGTYATDMSAAFATWYANRCYSKWFQLQAFDYWYIDDSFASGESTKNCSKPMSTPTFQTGLTTFIADIRALKTIKIMGNADHDLSVYSGSFEGGFNEGLMGLPYSIIKTSWDYMMARYRGQLANIKPGGISGFNIYCDLTDYKTMRFGLTSCLMDDGYFSCTTNGLGYVVPHWYEEYDANLGDPIVGPSLTPWQNGVYRRNYQHGIVLCNPTAATVTVTLERPYQKILGLQPGNDGSIISQVSLPGNDGLILLPPTQARRRINRNPVWS